MTLNILVVAEHRAHSIRRVALEALGVADAIRQNGAAAVHCFIAGEPSDALMQSADQLLQHGADHVHLACGAIHQPLQAITSLPSLLVLIQQLKPTYIIAGHTSYSKELLPRAAAACSAGYIADVTSLDMEDDKVYFTRPIYGGRAFETKCFTGQSPFIFSIRHNNFSPAEAREPAAMPIDSAVSYMEPASDPLPYIIKKAVQEISGSIDLLEADIIVSGGRGVKGRHGFQLLQQLADQLGGAVGASRGACDAGYCDYSLQIGQTGKIVTPKLYIACGISGAIQHLTGMSQSDTIVAINKDPEAPIFSVADYGIIGDVFEVVPLFIEELKAWKEGS